MIISYFSNMGNFEEELKRLVPAVGDSNKCIENINTNNGPILKEESVDSIKQYN